MKVLDRLRFEHAVVAGSVAALFLTALLVGSPAPAGPLDERFEGHSRAVSRSGTKALALLLQRQGFDVHRHERRFDLISGSIDVLFILSPNLGLEKGEETALSDWIREGGTVVVMPSRTKDTHGILDPFGLELVEGTKETEPVASTLDLSSAWPELQTPYRLSTDPGVRLKVEAEKGISWIGVGDATGWTAALGRWGQGTVVAFSDTRPARNDALLEADHDALFVHLAHVAAKDGAVAFDEYHHGHVEGQGPLTFVLDSSAGPAVYHAVAILFVIVIATGRRLGPPVALREGQRRRPAEFLEALARLLRATRNSGLALKLILADVTSGFRARFGKSDSTTIASAAARRGIRAEPILEALQAAERAAREKPSSADLVRLARDLEDARRRMTRSKGR